MITITIEHGEAGARCRIETAPGDPPLRLELPDCGILTTTSLPEAHFNPAQEGSREGMGEVRQHFWESRPLQLLALAGVLVLALQVGSMLGGLRDVSGARPVTDPIAIPDPGYSPHSRPIIDVPPGRSYVTSKSTMNAGGQVRHLPGQVAVSAKPSVPATRPDLLTATRQFNADLSERPRIVGAVGAPGGVVNEATGREAADTSPTPPHAAASPQGASNLSLFGLKP